MLRKMVPETRPFEILTYMPKFEATKTVLL